MLNFFASCGLCSSIPNPGDNAYQAYHKHSNNHFEQSSRNGDHQNRIVKCVVAGEYTFRDLVQEYNREVFIRKVRKCNYQQLEKVHRERGTNYIDREFPHQECSIGEVEQLKVRAHWKRIPEIVKNPIFINENIDPSSIFQGSQGDNYFLSAISALSTHPSRILSLFPSLKMHPSGIYMARILFKGTLQEVIVDDYIPVNQHGEILFAKPGNGRQIWIMILEKCWAKLNGSYSAVIGGLPCEVLRAFSGAPTFEYQINCNNKEKVEKMWQRVVEEQKIGAVFCCATKSEEKVQYSGLMQGHGYTLLQVYSHPYRMVKLQNPYPAHNQYKGRACHSDWQFWSSIAPVQRQNLGYSQQNHSNTFFFMLWQDFINNFDLLDICKINPNANYSSHEELFSKKRAEMFQFEHQGGDLTICLSQQPQTSRRRRIYSRSILILGRVQPHKIQGIQYHYVSSSSSKDTSSEHYLELYSLQKGKYIVYSKILLNSSQTEPATLSLYSQNPVHLISVSQSKYKMFLYQVFLDHARKNNKKQFIGPEEWICNQILLKECGYGYVAFHLEEGNSRKLGIQIEQKEYIEKRFRLKKPYRGKGLIKASLESGKELIVLFLIKSQKLPQSVTLPVPKIYNLI